MYSTKNVIITFLLALSLTSCSGVQTFKKITPEQLPAYKAEIGYSQNKKVYNIEWVQPSNIKEKCEIAMEGYRSPEQADIEVEYTWDGDCQNGKATGLGKVTYASQYSNAYEINYVKNGKSENFYYYEDLDANKVRYGKYDIEDHKIIGQYNISASKDENGELVSYSQLYEDHKKGIAKGTGKTNQQDGGYSVVTAVFGEKLSFGRINGFDSDKKQQWTWWGYADIANNRLDLYGILRNNHGLWHFKYDKGTRKEQIQLPEIFSDTVNNVVAESEELSNKTFRFGNQALIMKKKYSQLHPTVTTQPKTLPPSPPKSSHSISTGTGFFISDDGYVLTNDHVIEGATNISVMLKGEKIDAKIISRDSANDIALLKVASKVKALPIEAGRKVSQGADISVIGFPNIGLQGNNQKATFGYLNANSGIRGDGRYYQISAPIQPGNSGSPLLNEEGEVIGIVSATLSQSAMLEATGSLAQNVNYAIKIAYALPMLIGNDVNFKKATQNKKLSKPQLINVVKPSIVLIVAE